MSASLKRRVDKLGQAAEPIRERLVNQQVQGWLDEWVEKATTDQIEITTYIHGQADPKEVKQEQEVVIELLLQELGHILAAQRDATPEEWKEARARVNMAFDAHYHNRDMTIDESRHDQEMSEKVMEDKRAGVPGEQSEAAEYFRQLLRQYPRQKKWPLAQLRRFT